MRRFSVHRSSMSRYMSKSSGYKRSSVGRRNSYKLGSSKFLSYLQDAKKLTDDIKESEKTEETEKETSAKSSALSKYSRTKAKDYSSSTSRFNNGLSAMEDSTDTFAKLFDKEDTDMDKAYDAAVKYADGYNDLYASVRTSSNSAVMNKAKYISSVTDLYARSLDKIGIKADLKGNLSVDKDKFMKAEKKDLEAVFSKKSSYVSHISEQADSIKLVSAMSTDTYSSGTSNSYTSAMSGSLFSRRY